MSTMSLRLPSTFLVAKRPLLVEGAVVAVGATITAAQGAALRNVSALVSGGFLLPDVVTNRHRGEVTGRKLVARSRPPQAYGVAARRKMIAG